MVKFKIKTKGARLIVRAKLSFDERINAAELDVFSRKLIKGFLVPKQVKKRAYEFTGPVGISVFSRMQKPIVKHDFYLILAQVIDCIEKLIKYKLSVKSVVWDINYVFINEATKEIQLLYLPGSSAAASTNLFMFFESLAYLTKPQLEADTDYASKFLYFVKSQQYFDPAVIDSFIQREEPTAFNTVKKRTVGNSGYMTDKRKDYYSHYEDDDEETGIMTDDEDEATGLMNEEEATSLLQEDLALSGDSDATDLLVESTPVRYPTLQRISVNETVQINKPVFRIGKERGTVDYFVSNNNAVSRSHADIITRGHHFFVIDLNSKNKTYINGKPLPVQQECEILNGDQLRLANEEFIFYI